MVDIYVCTYVRVVTLHSSLSSFVLLMSFSFVLLFFLSGRKRKRTKRKGKINVVGVVAHLVEHPLGVGEARGSKPCNSNFLKSFFILF